MQEKMVRFWNFTSIKASEKNMIFVWSEIGIGTKIKRKRKPNKKDNINREKYESQ